MTKAEFEVFYVLVRPWIAGVILSNVHKAQSVETLGFLRLSAFFKPQLLEESRVVIVDKIPVPPLRRMGLNKFAAFEKLNPISISYLDTCFISRCCDKEENVHFHELVHVIQWRLLGPERFLTRYLQGLQNHDHNFREFRKSPLEAMAFDLQARFESAGQPFDVESEVASLLS